MSILFSRDAFFMPLSFYHLAFHQKINFRNIPEIMTKKFRLLVPSKSDKIR